MQMGEITAVREGSAADGLVQVRNRLEGDVILKVEVTEPDGKTRTSWGRLEADLKKNASLSPIDPLRLPFDLQSWADRLFRKKPQPTTDERTVTLYVRRHNKQGGEQYREEAIKLAWDNSWRFRQGYPLLLIVAPGHTRARPGLPSQNESHLR